MEEMTVSISNGYKVVKKERHLFPSSFLLHHKFILSLVGTAKHSHLNHHGATIQK